MQNTEMLGAVLLVALTAPAATPPRAAAAPRTPSPALPAVTRPASAAPDANEPAALGLAVNLPANAPPAARQKALEEVRAAGVSLFALELSWREAEPRPGRHRVAEITRTARLLRQSGAVLHLDLPLVNGRTRLVPPDLASVAFDDTKLALRLGRLFDALGPALLDFSTISLGNEADSYFAAAPDELTPFRRLFLGALEYLSKRAPRILLGVATAPPADSGAPEVVAALHDRSPALFYIYAPFLRDAPFTHRPPSTIDRDWAEVLSRARGRPVAFTEVSFSSARENGSSPARQAEFVRRMRRLLGATPRSRLLFARYVPWRDPPPPPLDRRRLHPLPPGEGAGGEGVDRTTEAPRRAAFFANRGLQKFDGTPKPAWKELGTRRSPPR